MGAPQRSAVSSDNQRRGLLRVVIGASFGNFIELYDIAVFALLIVPLSASFFPKGSGTAAVLGALAIFGSSFVARPFGGIVFGRIADQRGRRIVLSVAILLMGAGTLVIGLLPTYAQIGIWAPALLTLCRLLQGISAGGEVGVAAVIVAEYAPPRRRGFWVGAVSTAAVLGLLAASGVVLLLTFALSTTMLNSWGWRVAFIVSAPLSLIGLYVRLKIDESPIYRAAVEATRAEPPHAPLHDVLRGHWRQLLQVIGLFSLGISSYLVVTYYPVYLRANTDLSAAQIATIPTIILAAQVVTIMFAAAWGDRIGRRPIVVLSGICAEVLAVPGLLLAGWGGFGFALLGGLLMAVPLPLWYGAQGAVVSELFPTAVRATGVGIGYNVSTLLYSGMAPFLASLLLTLTGNSIALAVMMMVVSLLGIWAAVKLPDTRGLRLDALDRDATDRSESIAQSSPSGAALAAIDGDEARRA